MYLVTAVAVASATNEHQRNIFVSYRDEIPGLVSGNCACEAVIRLQAKIAVAVPPQFGIEIVSNFLFEGFGNWSYDFGSNAIDLDGFQFEFLFKPSKPSIVGCS